ncbi:MAG: hypothetical protein M3347_07550, partial [Armatimonadota bacterium]|nr:hypothetical protein [Armatimonadota bacterium]
MHYVIYGATSGTGDRVIKALVEKVGADNITCLVRPTSDTRLLQTLGLRLHVGDVNEPDSYRGLLNKSTIYIDMTHPKYYPQSI